MSARAIRWARERFIDPVAPILTRRERALLFLLATYHNDTGRTEWPSLPALADQLAFTERSVRRLRDGLKTKEDLWLLEEWLEVPYKVAAKRWGKIAKRKGAVIFARDGHQCLICQATTDLTVDHIIPLARGGSNDDDNLRTLCRSCNSRKGARLT